MSRKTAWITGAGGFIGSHVARLAAEFAPDWEAKGLERRHVDLTDFAALRRRFAEDQPALIVHCAAVSRTPLCQAQPDLAQRLNVEATRILADLAEEIPLIFLSSDLVFDGKAGNYDELAQPNPINVYAETKATAEQIVLANPRHTVIRASLNAGVSLTGDRAFNEDMVNSWRAGRTLTLFTDEFRNPIPAESTARIIWTLVQANAPGLYHVAGRERLSRWEIGQLLAARWPNLNPRLRPASLCDYSGPPRSPDTSLNCGKVQKLLSFPLPEFSEWVKTLNRDASG